MSNSNCDFQMCVDTTIATEYDQHVNEIVAFVCNHIANNTPIDESLYYHLETANETFESICSNAGLPSLTGYDIHTINTIGNQVCDTLKKKGYYASPSFHYTKTREVAITNIDVVAGDFEMYLYVFDSPYNC